MAIEHVTHDALIDRADQAIADSISIRAKVRTELTAAGRRSPHRPSAGDARPSGPMSLELLLLDSFLEPWWSLARSLSSAGNMIRAADDELERSWRRYLPRFETPSALFYG